MFRCTRPWIRLGCLDVKLVQNHEVNTNHRVKGCPIAELSVFSRLVMPSNDRRILDQPRRWIGVW
ncbi:hypothetical protein BDV32DRAFT_129848 [Aspergillus pseudonomiae]|nr:hypothetical protein BDV32DRAFT_129848 [Aspergillus pseudonomiae]